MRERTTSPLAKFGSGHQPRNTRARKGKTYKYLGTEESDGIQRQQMEGRLKEEHSRRLRMVLKSEVNAKNEITATGALAVPVLRYSFGIINWRLQEIKEKIGKPGRY
jgi:hypothetical protein